MGDYAEAESLLAEVVTLCGELQHPRLLVGVMANRADCPRAHGPRRGGPSLARRIMQDAESPHLSSPPEGNVHTTAAYVFLRVDRFAAETVFGLRRTRGHEGTVAVCRVR
ncbi:MAG: hypothetical protein IPJ28_13585 [Betaproteobacteria bacterium]|nr:hypothetical protein [Betaproteobacteria bacterium]